VVSFGRVLIVGVGLIGGSWALALRRAGFAGPILGFDTPAGLEAIRARGVVDDLVARAPLAADVRGGDLVLLATPVGVTLKLLEDLAPSLPEGVVVSDTGSTKRAICAAAASATRATFVGGHPMAGSERSGIEVARADLFDGAPYFLVSPPAEAADRVAEAVVALGARPVFMDAAEHDHLVALASHLPQLVSTSLAAVLAGAGGALPGGPGLAAMTRLAASPWSVWADILATNRDLLAGPLDDTIGTLTRLRDALVAGDDESIRLLFERAGAFARKDRRADERE
jgi:prephenate dehydrogenase